jgi:HPt (histidine-containing phosphotransfer) domain-containing protein
MTAPGFPPGSELQQALEQFRAQFAASLPERLAEARERLASCRAAPGDDERLRALHRVLHRLAGSAGTFGMPDLGAASRAIEEELEVLLEQPARTRADFDATGRAIAALAGN